MRFLTVLALACVSATLHAEPGRSLARTPGPLLTIAVFTPPDVEESLVDRILTETEAIWSEAGVAFEWDRTPSAKSLHPWQLVVTFDGQRKDFPETGAVLGWILFTPDGPTSSIHLSRANAEALSGRTAHPENKTTAGHELLIGRALGRALSHELGHYLFQSKAHSPHGLMRANWPSDELFSVDRRTFRLTADQRAAAEHLVASSNPASDEAAAVSTDRAQGALAGEHRPGDRQ